MILTLRKESPTFFLITNESWMKIRSEMAAFFVEFVQKTRPLAIFEQGNIRERQQNISKYFKDYFTQEKHLILRAENNEITAFVLIDPFGYSLENREKDDYELVIAGSLDGNPYKSKRDLLEALDLYKKEVGEIRIAANINREFKRGKFEKFVKNILEFEEISKNYYAH